MRNLIFSLALVVLTACSGNESPEQYVSRAKAYLAEADYNSATIELKNALRLDNNAAEARWLLGKVSLEQGDFPTAEKELERARDLGWTADDVYPALAQALLEQGKPDEVLGLDHKTLSPLPGAELIAHQARAELVRGNPEQARKLVELALEKDPASTLARLMNARLLATRGNTGSALALADEVLENQPGNADAWRLKGDILLYQRELDAARDAFTQAIKHSPIAFGDLLKRALINLDLEDYAAAQADADALLGYSPEHPAANYVQGLLHFNSKAYPDAITALQIAEPIADQYPPVLFYLGSAHFVEGNTDQATRYANRYVTRVPDDVSGRKLLAALYLQQRETAESRAAIQPVLDIDPQDVEALSIMANALLLDGQTDQGLELLARIAALQPESPLARMRLGAGLMLSGKGDQAEQHLQAALDINPEFQQADLLLILNHLEKQDYDSAIEAAEAYQRRNISKATPYNVLGKVYLAADRPDDARDAYDKALKFDAGDRSARLGLAQIALAAGDDDTARQQYLAILEHHPDNLQALLQLATLEARAEDEEAMVGWLKRAIDGHPRALEPRLMLGRYYLSSGKADQVAPLFADLDDLQRRSDPVLEITALAQLSAQQHGVAQTSLEQLIVANPESAQYHYLLARAASGAGDRRKALRELQEAHRLDPDHVPTRVALARLALVEQRQADYDEQMAALQKLAPDAPDVLRLRAIAAMNAGNNDEAVQLATRVFEAAPSTQTLLELAAFQKRTGDAQAARQLLQRWTENNPEDVAARLALANDLQMAGDTASARAQYLAVVERDPDNFEALNNLAWNLRLDDAPGALKFIRRAAAAAPDNPDVLDTLAVIEHLNGEHRAAYRNIERALNAAPENPTMRYHKAMIAAALGEKEQAITLLQALLAEGTPEFPEMTEAQKLLTSLQR